jgi:predicted PurR-regulated permease PerM
MDVPASLEVRGLRLLLFTLAAIVIVVAGISFVGGLFVLLAFSALASVVARRAQLWLLDRGLPRWAALVIPTGGFVLILVILGVAVVASIAAVGLRLAEESERIQEWLAVAEDTWASITGVPGSTLPPIEPQAALGAARSVLAALSPAVTSVALSVLIVIYVLLGAKGLHGRMLRATSSEVIARYDALATELVTYVKVRAALGAGAALADTALLLVLGVPYAVLWGLISFLLSFIPNIGFILALIPPAAFALLEHGPLSAIAVVAGYVVINLAFDYVLQPRVFATTLEVSPVVTIVTILVWSLLIGPAGALLAVPLTITLRAILLPFPGTAWFVAFLGQETSVQLDDPPVAAAAAEPPGPDAGEPTIGA